MKNSKKLIITLLAPIALFALVAISCSFTGSSSGPQPDLTLTAMSETISGTATAFAAQGDQPLINLETAEARATVTTAAIQGTQAARATSVDVNQAGTATAEAPVVAELAFYHLNTTVGHVGWVTTTQDMLITGYEQTKIAIAPVTASDFVLATNITWNTQYSTNGCGVMFRLNGDRNKPDAYMLFITRFATGHAIFTALVNGQLANIHDYYPKDNDNSFNASNGGTNRLAVVANGNIIDVYTNQAKIAEIDTTKPPTQIVPPPKPVKPLDSAGQAAMDKYLADLKDYQDNIKLMQTQYSTALANYSKNPAIFTNGFVGLSALSESGRTECKFDNTWLWIIGH